MSTLEIFILAIGLSMDAFAVSICKGLSVKKLKLKHALICGVWFGFFQALMPVIGYFLGVSFAGLIEAWDHWIAFFLLLTIGISMLREAFKKEDCECGKNDKSADFSFMTMLSMAVATSIDALSIGVSFAFLNVDIFRGALFIGVVTFLTCVAGVKVGNVFGTKYEKSAQIAGGIILVLIGIKIVLSHTGIIGF